MKTQSTLILLLLFTLSISCKDEEVSPQKAILGKWEFIGIGNGRIEAPSGVKWYYEYFEDSLRLHYQSSTGQIVKTKYYWENSGFLNTEGTTYKCVFYRDTMQLDYVHINAIFMSSFFKRIK
ncbi:hypothetical protein [Flectobacillus sp. BAB-3569]|uniref:hypothetical protein n=1 Tax=Flectobacillus sp. BAB-3569 TaxID=1509483 RepID=UPI000BA36944|nr:hypothetical protein [Flectobacillus sp. BAB-3569]PAC29018.1 hypothetical protein BWI92_17395 [Flectobacillus sp. BAB-3569]